MTDHTWVLLEDDAGSGIGKYDYWECSVCGAQGGAYSEPWLRPYKYDDDMPLSEDCDEAKVQIENYKVILEARRLEKEDREGGPDRLLDKDGYPTEYTLRRVREWAPTDGVGLLEFIRSIWWGGERQVTVQDVPEVTYYPVAHYQFHTGGWSGNEDLIAAMEENKLWWTIHWWSSQRGGHYTFEVRK